MLLRRLRLFRHRLKLMLSSTEQRNILYLYGEIVFAGVLAAAGSFDSAFILRLGGSSALIGLLSSVPALLAIFLYLPSARVLERRPNSMPWLVGSLLLSRITYLLIFALPFVLSRRLPEATSTMLIAMTVPAVFFTTGWSPLLTDVVPKRSLATVLAWRSILSSATIAVLVFAAGVWLDRGTFPRNYQWMYVVGFLGGIVSVFLVSRIRLPPTQTALPVASVQKMPWKAALSDAMRTNQAFLKFIGGTLFYSLGMWMVSPLYIIYFIRQLGAADSWVGLRTTLAHVGVVLGYWLWRRILKRIGERRALLIARPLLAAYAFLVALVPNLNVLLAIGFVINVVGPGVGLSQSVIMLDLLPKERRFTWIAVHSTIMNIGAFACPLIGVALSDRFGIVPALLVGGSLRMVGALVLSLQDVSKRRRTTSGSSLRPRLFGGMRR